MNTYFKELSRVLAKNEIETAPPENGRLPILLSGQSVGRVEPDGTMCLVPNDITTPEANELYFKVAPIAEMVSEYTKSMEKTFSLTAEGLDEEYRLLAEFNGTVLAGRETEYGMKFATWDWSYDKTGLYQGHYYMDEYISAKEDFAKRSGLVSENRLFSSSQLTEMYRCMADTIDSGYELTDEQTKLIEDTQKQIEYAVPDLNDKIAQVDAQALQQNM